MKQEEKKEYNAKQFFDTRYDKMPEFKDKYTLSPTTSTLEAALHYKRLEVNIIKALISQDLDLDKGVMNACDIGSGTGYWVRFLRKSLHIKNIVAIELSTVACEQLKRLFSDDSNISIENIDISSDSFQYEDFFDLVTAIATCHHIVNDQAWESALKNISIGLKQGGVALITANCGFKTKDKTFISKNEFTRWQKQDHKRSPSEDTKYLMKRSRSLRFWKRTFQNYGCKVENVIWYNGRKFLDRFKSQMNLLVVRKN